MSTKTNFKRIAVVAVASLGLGVFTSIAPANATPFAVTQTTDGTPWAVTAAYSGVSATSSTASQVVGGTVTLTFSETVTIVDVSSDTDGIIGNITSSGVGSITAASSSVDADVTIKALGTIDTTAVFPNTGVSRVSNSAATVYLNTTTVVVNSTVAGVQTVTGSVNNSNGTPTGSWSATITWIAATATGINAAQSTMWLQTSPTCATSGTSKAVDLLLAGASGVSSGISTYQPYACVYARDAAGNLVGTATSIVFNTLGSSASIAATADGKATSGQLPAPSSTGATTFTAIITDVYGNTASLTAPFTYYGSLATLELKNVTFAAAYNGVAVPASATAYDSIVAAAAGDIGTPTSKVGALILVAKDSKGAQIDLGVEANGTGSTFTVDSSAFPGVPADRTSDAIASSVATSYDATAGTDVSKLGGNALAVTCGTSKAEKLTITAWGTTSAGVLVKSNSVDFYCSDAAAKVTVTASGTSVNVDVTDANSFPVADGTSVALAASNGSVVAPAAKTTSNGKFATAATFIANSTAATSSVTAIVGSISGTSAAVKGSGTSIEAQIASMLKLINKIMKRLNIR
jgi:sulfur carrier protein ThiS